MVEDVRVPVLQSCISQVELKEKIGEKRAREISESEDDWRDSGEGGR